MMKVLAKMSQFVNKTFALWVVIFGIAGFVFPQIFKQIGPWIAPLLGVVMFGMGLTLSPSDFREIFRRPATSSSASSPSSRSCPVARSCSAMRWICRPTSPSA